jgi:hypothetical protein
MDWEELLSLARRHGVLPLVALSLGTTLPACGTQAGVLARLRSDLKANALRNVALAKELLRVLDLCRAQHIPALALKGPVLAATAYGDLALRRFGDLDLLVRRQDVLRVRELLYANGYRPEGHGTPAERQGPSGKQAAPLRSWYCIHLERATLGTRGHSPARIALDLHWRLRPRGYGLRVDPGDLWQRSVWVSLIGARVRSLSPGDTLLFLCLHGCEHHWHSLRQVCDVAQVVRAYPELDWEGVIGRARRAGCARRLSVGLLLAGTLLGVHLPRDVRQAIDADSDAARLATRFAARLFDGGAFRVSLSEELATGLQIRESLRDRAAYGTYVILGKCNLRRVVNPTAADRAVLALPRPLAFLYYVVRPIRLLLKYGL